MKANNDKLFGAFVGIDWADKKHDICEYNADSDKHFFSVISSKPEAIHEWAMEIKARFPGRKIAVACELKKGPLIFALSKYGHITIFPITPITVKRYRDAFTNSGAKNDPKDALIQVEILTKHRDKLKALNPDSAQVRALAQLTEERRKLVQDRVDLTNKITQLLKCYYPQALDLFGEKDTTIFCQFLIKWPSLAAAKRARKQTLLNFLNQYNARYQQVNEDRVALIKNATPLTDDPGVTEPYQIITSLLIPQLQVIIDSITFLDKEIKHRYKNLKDSHIFDSLPGAGDKMAPRLLVAFGSDRSRYDNASALQKYVGVAPVVVESGKKSTTRWRHSCPKFLRQTFVEWAGLTIRFSFWAKAFYLQQIEKGKHHNSAIRALAFKWIRIVFQCWKTNTPYDEARYLSVLKERKSPLLKYAVGC